MVMRNRTPRRRKVWAQFNESTPLDGSSPKSLDMLGAYYTDLGAGQQGGLTVMRIVGSLQLTDWTAGATTQAISDIRVGVAWLDRLVADAGDGDAQIPEPLQDGIRETSWIQQWKLTGIEQSSADVAVGRPAQPQLDRISYICDIDVTQQRKQPNAGARLAMIISGGSGFETNTMVLEAELSIMLALP